MLVPNLVSEPKTMMLRLFFLLALGLSPCLSHYDFVTGDVSKLSQRLEQQKPIGRKWVLLVAGSKDYSNYRHQADVCHAYQVVYEHGIPDSRIVVMMYDDIANNPKNRFKGAIYNRPNGQNVYAGVPKDYTGEDVTAKNFLSILTGNRDAMKGIGSGKVIFSNIIDYVFVFYSGPGSPGLVDFPTGAPLYKNDLAYAIIAMHAGKNYSKMVFYMEASYSGSMFYQNLATNTKVYATTSTNRSETSVSCYWDYEIGAFLGNYYSVSWMEDSDLADLNWDTLYKQYKHVRKLTWLSEVKEFGDISMRDDHLGEFQGDKRHPAPNSKFEEIRNQVPSPDVKLHTLENMIRIAKSVEEQNNLRKQLKEEYEIRNDIANAVRRIAKKALEGQDDLAAMSLYSTPKLNNMPCYKAAIKQFNALCYNHHMYEFALRQFYVLGNLCDAGVMTEKIMSSISQECSK